MNKKTPKVSVVMSNYNGMKLNLLHESLSSILKNDYPNLEVILVDNASTDDSVVQIKKRFSKNPRLIVIQNPVNMYSQGLNLGLARAQGEYVAFFNNDVVVENGHFQRFINFLDRDKKIALAQGKLVSYFNHQIIDSAGETMDQYGNPITIGAGCSSQDYYNQVAQVLSVSGSCSILRKSVVSEIGAFDQDYGIGYEDLDLSLRAWLRGYKVVYYPKVLAYHKRAATDVSPSIRALIKWHFNKNRITTLIKNYPTSFLLSNLPVTVLIYIFAGLSELLVKRSPRVGIARFTSLVWVVTHLPQILRKRRAVQKSLNNLGKNQIHKLLYKGILVHSFFAFLKIKEPTWLFKPND